MTLLVRDLEKLLRDIPGDTPVYILFEQDRHSQACGNAQEAYLYEDCESESHHCVVTGDEIEGKAVIIF